MHPDRMLLVPPHPYLMRYLSSLEEGWAQLVSRASSSHPLSLLAGLVLHQV